MFDFLLVFFYSEGILSGVHANKDWCEHFLSIREWRLHEIWQDLCGRLQSGIVLLGIAQDRTGSSGFSNNVRL